MTNDKLQMTNLTVGAASRLRPWSPYYVGLAGRHSSASPERRRPLRHRGVPQLEAAATIPSDRNRRPFCHLSFVMRAAGAPGASLFLLQP
jgi:hypothetical protein